MDKKLRNFIELDSFRKAWEKYGLTDDDLRNLESDLILNPQMGQVISGTKGLRKIRVALPGKGKRGGARVIYVNFEEYLYTIFLYFYPKNKDPDLSSEDRKLFSDLVGKLEDSVRKNFFNKRGKK